MNRIAELRKKNNLSQTELAEQLNIAQNTLSQYENELRTPSSRIVLYLADLFGVTPNYLMGEAEPDAQKNSDLHCVTKILKEEDPTRVNLYLRKGWRLLHVGEDRSVGHDGAGYSNVVYTLGWTDDPQLSAARPLPENYSNEYEGAQGGMLYKMCRDEKTGEEVCVFYDDPDSVPPDVIVSSGWD